MSDRLYLRTAVATVWQKGKEDQARRLGVRLRFKAEKLAENYLNPGSANLDLFNLSNNSINLLSAPNAVVRLDAGYSDRRQVLFIMDVFKATQQRNGPDRVTTLDLVDGGVALQNAHVEFSLKAGSTNAQAFKKGNDALTGEGVTLGHIDVLPALQYAKGYVFSGTVAALLAQLCAEVGYTWNIHDGALNVYDKQNGTGELAFVLSKSTGLIGIPSRDAMNGQSPFYTFKSLLNPRLAPGKQVKVKSRFVPSGFYSIWKAVHEGDTMSGDYSTVIECQAATANG